MFTTRPLYSEDTFSEPFDWDRYLQIRGSEKVPEEYFFHVNDSEQNGIPLKSVVEVENEDQNGYWFATVCSSKGVSINLHYFGDENDTHDFWIEVKSSRIHPLNWGQKNNKKLVPPHPDRFLSVNREDMKEKVNCYENIPNCVLQMQGAPIYNIFKIGMYVEVQDSEYPYRMWISKILKNVGGRLFLKMQGISSPEHEPFWLFYSNYRIFPVGWAEQKGLPWRIMNTEVFIKESDDSRLLINVIKPKTPEQHSYKVGDMLEALNPYSLMVFYVAKVIKIFDNRYFKIEVNNDCESDLRRRLTFVATKDNPYLFNPGWARKNKFVLKSPLDWTSFNRFSWKKYSKMKNAKLARVKCARENIFDNIHIGKKLEAVDPVNPDHIRIATVKGFIDQWLILTFDRTNWSQEILHVRSIYSDDIFPSGWCNKHKYLLSIPKLPFIDNNNYGNQYYASDIDTDIIESHEDFLIQYPNYFKGDIPYHHFSQNERLDDEFEESPSDILSESDYSGPSKYSNVPGPIIDITMDENDSDTDLYSGLLTDKIVPVLSQNVQAKTIINTRKRKRKKRRLDDMDVLSDISPNICIYFNKNCVTNYHFIQKKILQLQNYIGPGPVTETLQAAVTVFVNLGYAPTTLLRKIKKNQKILYDGSAGVSMSVNAMYTKNGPTYSESLRFPDGEKMAQSYCSAICQLSEICENFMTVKKTKCHRCMGIEDKFPEVGRKKKARPPSPPKSKTDKSYIFTSSTNYADGKIIGQFARVTAKKPKVKKTYVCSSTNTDDIIERTKKPIPKVSIRKSKAKKSYVCTSTITDDIVIKEEPIAVVEDTTEPIADESYASVSPLAHEILEIKEEPVIAEEEDTEPIADESYASISPLAHEILEIKEEPIITEEEDTKPKVEESCMSSTDHEILEIKEEPIITEEEDIKPKMEESYACTSSTSHTDSEIKEEIKEEIKDEIKEEIKDISKVSAEQLDWSNKPLVDRFKHYMACIVNYEHHITTLDKSPSQLELALLAEIETKKAHLSLMDDIDIFSNTKSDRLKVEDEPLNAVVDWKTTFENFYRQSSTYKDQIIQVDDFEHINVLSNPKYWSPQDVYDYLSQDVYCEDIKQVLFDGVVDGEAFMLLNEEQLVHRLGYPINLAIRVMCHVAHVKHVCLSEY